MRPLHASLVVVALLALGWSAWETRDLLILLYGDSGGLGAVSAGFSEDLLAVVAVLAVLAVNLALRGPATRTGLLATRLRRAHLYLTLAYVAAGLATASALLMPGTFERAGNDVAMTTILLTIVLGTTLVPVQAFFLFAAIAFTVERLWSRRNVAGA